MASTLAPSSNNVLLGRGAVYFDQFTAGTVVKTGELHLGNITNLELNVEQEKKEMYSSLTGMANLYKSVQYKRTWKGKMTGSEFSKENLALLNLGATGTLTQSTASVTSEQITASAVQGRYYPTVYRGLSAVTITSGASAPGTSKTVATDYTIDAETGRIYVVPGGGITGGHVVVANYTYASMALDVVNGSSAATIDGYLRFVGDPACGPEVEMEVWHVSLTPSAVNKLITDDFGTWDLDFDVFEELTAHPTCPTHRLIYR